MIFVKIISMSTLALDNLLSKFGEATRREERIDSIKDWAEGNRTIPAGDSVWPGKMSYDRVPYMLEILACFDPASQVREVAFQKGSQVMGTGSLTESIIGYYMAERPCPIMLVGSSAELIMKSMQPRILRMIRNSKSLDSKIIHARRGAINFVNGNLYMTGPSIPNNFRNVAIKILILEEITAYPASARGEGSVIELAKTRTATYEGSRKILYISSARSNADEMDKRFNDGDSRFYHVPCPLCGHYQRLVFNNIKYEMSGDRVLADTVVYQCGSCQKTFEETHKPRLFDQGFWQVSKPENARKDYRSYHLSALYSPFGLQSWADIAARYERAKKEGGESLRVFFNTVLGENYTDADVVTPTLPEIFAKIQNGKYQYLRGAAPLPLLYVTIGVDVQLDRLEVEVLGWATEKRSFSIDYYILRGDPALHMDPAGCWAQLTRILVHLSKINIFHVCLIDAGNNGYQVYDFLSKYKSSEIKGIIMPIVGESPAGATYPYKIRPVEGYGQMKRLHINTPLFKSMFFSDSFQTVPAEGIPPRYCSFPTDYDRKHFDHLYLSEKPVRVKKSGKEITEWVKLSRHNHALDARVYAMSAAFYVREFVCKNLLNRERVDSDAADAYFAEFVGAKLVDLRET